MRSRSAGRHENLIQIVGIDKAWKHGKWLPAAPPEVGFLGSMSPGLSTMLIQYWRSFDHLERYARATDKQHWPAWVEFNRRMKNARGDVGIWHETYLVRAGEYETVYSGMPSSASPTPRAARK